MLEKDFETSIATVSQLMGCKYFKIPDTKMLNAGNRYYNREQKRPFDAVLITPYKTYVIEAKIQYGALKPHQLVNIELSNKINPNTGYVVRWFPKFIRIDYHENGSITKIKVADIKELITYFKTINKLKP